MRGIGEIESQKMTECVERTKCAQMAHTQPVSEEKFSGRIRGTGEHVNYRAGRANDVV